MKMPHRERIGRLIVSVFVLAYIVLVSVYLSPPSPWRDVALQPVQKFVDYVGLWQDYCLFAPDPPSTNIDLSAELTFADGRKEIWNFPRMEKLNLFERIIKERYRKFGDDHVASEAYLWPDLCRYLSRVYAARGKPPVSITLIKRFADIPPPEKGLGKVLPEHSEEARFFTYQGG